MELLVDSCEFACGSLPCVYYNLFADCALLVVPGSPGAVARRLSEQAERRRSVHTPSTGGSALGSAGGGSAGGAPGSVGGASGGPSTPGEHPHPHGRVIDFIPEGGDLAGVLGDGEDVAVVRVLSAPQPIPPIEATGAR